MSTDKQDKMFSLVKEWEESGQTIKSFCEENHLQKATFHYWRKKYRALDEPEDFIPLEIERQPQTVKDGIEICYPNGTIIRVPAHCDLNLIRSLANLG